MSRGQGVTGQGGEGFYGALEDYNTEFRHKKLLIQQKEDKINYLRSKLEEMAKEDEMLEKKFESLQMDSEKLDMEFERDVKIKDSLETKKKDLEMEADDLSASIEGRFNLIQRIESFREQQLVFIEQKHHEFEAAYRKIPSIKSYMELTEEYERLAQIMNKKNEEVLGMRESVQNQRTENKKNWQDFVKICVTTAELRSEIHLKQKEVKEAKLWLEKAQQAEDLRNSFRMKLTDYRRSSSGESRIDARTKPFSIGSALNRIVREKSALQDSTNIRSNTLGEQRLEQLRSISSVRHQKTMQYQNAGLPTSLPLTGRISKASSAMKMACKPTSKEKTADKNSSRTHSVIADYLKLVKSNHQQTQAEPFFTGLAETSCRKTSQFETPKPKRIQELMQVQLQIQKDNSVCPQNINPAPDCLTPPRAAESVAPHIPETGKNNGRQVEVENSITDDNFGTLMEGDEANNEIIDRENCNAEVTTDRNSSISNFANTSERPSMNAVASADNDLGMTDIEHIPLQDLRNNVLQQAEMINSYKDMQGNNAATKESNEFKTPQPPKPGSFVGFGSDFFSPGGLEAPSSASSVLNGFGPVFGFDSSLTSTPASQSSDGFQMDANSSGWTLTSTPVTSKPGGEQSNFMDFFSSGLTSSSTPCQGGMSFF